MSLDCVITVKGAGEPSQSRPTNDQTRTVSDFLVGVDAYYRAVFNHVKACNKCDPQEILEEYLKDRNRPKFCGTTSKGLMTLAERYLKQFPTKVRPETVREFKWRIGSISGLINFIPDATPEEIVSGALVILENWRDNDFARGGILAEIIRLDLDGAEKLNWPYTEFFKGLHMMGKPRKNAKLPKREDLMQLAQIAYVMGS